MVHEKPKAYQIVKRIIDLVGGLVGFFIFALLYLPIGMAIKLNTRGPILIRAKRVSGGQIINLYKFRSMVEEAPLLKSSLQHLNERGDGPFFKIKADPRITGVGKIIRRFRLDEFPQFINVLKSEMSIVGPRPYEPEEIAAYPKEFTHLTKLKAGITGLAQVNGSSMLSFQKTLELDEYYNQHQSIGMDLRIILKTVAIILFDPTAV